MLFIYFQESLVALTLNNKLPRERGEGLCVVFLSMGDQEAAVDYRVKLWRLGTCNEFRALGFWLCREISSNQKLGVLP